MSQYLFYFSATGRTKKTAQVFLDAWGGAWTAVDLCEPLPPLALTAEDTCLFALSVYEGRIPAPAVPKLQALTGNGASAILMAVYGNRAIDDFLLELEDLLAQRGFRCRAALEAVAEHSILPQFGAGRPDEADRAELSRYAETIRSALGSGTLPAQVAVPGKRPYVDMGGVPVHAKATKACISCGLCAQKCPVGAIPKDRPMETNTDTCITCMRCIQICPKQARKLSPFPLTLIMGPVMKHKLGGHQPNRLYLEG